MPRTGIAIGLALALAVGSVPASAQELLRWRLEPGETLRYRVSTAAFSRLEGVGPDMELGTDQAVTTSGVVREVNARGDATVDWTYARVELVSAGPPPMGRQAWDSAVDPSRLSVPTALRPQIELLAGRLGQTVQAVQDPRGRVLELRGVEAIASRLLESVTDPALVRLLREGNAGSISPETVRQSFAGAAAYLPDRPVAPGSSWITPRGEPGDAARAQPSIQLTNTVEAFEDRGGERVAVIRHDGVVPVRASDATESLVLSGTTVFSIERGRVLSSTLTTELVREIPVPNPPGIAPGDAGVPRPPMRTTSTTTMATELLAN